MDTRFKKAGKEMITRNRINEKYQIITNFSRRKILVINDVLDVDRTPELDFEDFDAMFINVINPLYDYTRLAIRLASPLLSEKCRFKPLFVTQRLQGWLGEAEIIVDGYASPPRATSRCTTTTMWP